MSEKEFVDGLIVKAPHEKAPDFVRASISIKIDELIGWLNDREGEWVNLDVKVGKSGKWYAEVNNWKPKDKGRESAKEPPTDFVDDDIPF